MRRPVTIITANMIALIRASRAMWKNEAPQEWAQEVRRARVDLDRIKIDALAAKLKAQGVRAPRTEAEERVARAQGETVDALRKRRLRSRRKM
jgi:hypothetical protein